MKVYHIVYEPSYESADIHFYLPCNLRCAACYTKYETLDFGLYDDPIALIAAKGQVAPPTHFLTFEEVMAKLRGLRIARAIFMGTEPALDPEMPRLAKALHEDFQAYVVMLTNGLKRADLADVDEVIFSLKAITPEIHKTYTGVSNERILANFRALAQAGQKMQAETVYIPGLIEAPEIERVAEFVGGVDPAIPLRIDAYFPVAGCPWRAAARAEVEEAARLAERYVRRVSFLTLDMKREGAKPLRIV